MSSQVDIKDEFQTKKFFFVLFFYLFSLWAYFVLKNYFKTLDIYISVKCERWEQLSCNTGGPGTHDDPHEGAVRTVARPLLVPFFFFIETIKILSTSDYYKYFFVLLE